MEKIFLQAVDLSIMACFIVLAVIILRVLFRRAPKWINCALWAIVAIRLVCPISMESQFSLMPDIKSVSDVLATEENNAVDEQINNSYANTNTDNQQMSQNSSTNNSHTGNHISNNQTESNPVVNNTIQGNQSNSNQMTGEPESGFMLDGGQENISNDIVNDAILLETDSQYNVQSMVHVASIVWIIGLTLMLMVAVISYIRLKLKVRTAIPLYDNIRQSENVSSPFVLGTVKPRIYLPFAIGEESIDYIIAHEQAHIKRYDNWVKIIAFVILAVYWFNPVMWLAYILLCKDIELACDENVVKHKDTEYKKAYSRALVANSVNHRTMAICPLAFGEVGVKARVKNVIRYKKPAFWIVVVAIAASVITAGCLLTSPKNTSAQNIQSEEDKQDTEQMPSTEDLTEDNFAKEDSTEDSDTSDSDEYINNEYNILYKGSDELWVQKADKVECDFGVTLPTDAYVTSQLPDGELFRFSRVWGIAKEGYDATKNHPYADKHYSHLASGWIELYEGQAMYGYIDGIYPCPYAHENTNESFAEGWQNYESISGGYMCEAGFTIEYGIAWEDENGVFHDEDGYVKYWCIIFETENDYGKRSNWIFLNQDCFTKDEAKNVAESYVPDWECDIQGNIMYKGDTFYTITDGNTSENIQPTKVQWKTADVKYVSDSERIGTNKLTFQWCIYNNALVVKNSEYNIQGSGWKVITIPGNNDEVMIQFSSSAVCEYTRYNLSTGKIINQFSDLPRGTVVMSEPDFTNDLSKAVIICDDGAKVYYYDIKKNEATDISKALSLCEGTLVATQICQEKAFLFIQHDEDDYIEVYDYEIETGNISVNPIGEILFRNSSDEYTITINEEYVLDYMSCYETGIFQFYNLNTGETIGTELHIEMVSHTGLVDPINKTVQVIIVNGEVWLLNYTTGEIVH